MNKPESLKYNIYYGHEVGQRVVSDGEQGTVTDPGYEPGDDVLERRCVPVVFDKNKATGMISWIKADGLNKI